MATEQDKIDNRINLPLAFIAAVITVIGIGLMLTAALMPLGLPIMLLGIIWLIALSISARVRAKHSRVVDPRREGPASVAFKGN
jgi:type IV secretory pathway VirB2 component (pilin)